MKVRFAGLVPEHAQRIILAGSAPVARFELEDGGIAHVLARDAHPFSDLDILQWRPELREGVLTALCASVEEASWADEQARTLDLAGRFAVVPDRDVRPWKVRGFTHLQTCDIKVIKHVLGVGSLDPERHVTWWSRVLGLPIDPPALLARLEAEGCTEWKRLNEQPDPHLPIRLYRSLSRRAYAECIRILAPLREAYRRAAYDAVRGTANEKDARHVHLRIGGEEVMHFLDDRGLLVIAKGVSSELAIATAYDAHADDETRLGEHTLCLRMARIFEERSSLALFHTPKNWRVTSA